MPASRRGSVEIFSSLPDAHPRPVGEHSRGDVHRRQLLEEQLRRVRNVHLRDLCLVPAGPTLERLRVQFPKFCQSKPLYILKQEEKLTRLVS
jgi:hypothetical protein